jgi:hypothetical protein
MSARGTRPAALAALAAAALLCASAPRAQSVVEILRQQRLEARVAEVADSLGPHVPVRPLVALGAADPFVAAHEAVHAARRAEVARREQAERDSLARAAAARPLTLAWDKAEPAEQGGFLVRFGETFWQAAQPLRTLAIDTTATPELRGRLQKVFGRPTRNADALRQIGYTGSEFVQFEYWFVVNDSIPVLVMDLDGPFGRGLLLAGDERQADLLPVLKADLSARLTEALGPNPWVDYYHSYERGRWFRTGYNGAETFTIEIRPPRWSRTARADRWIIHR